MQQTRFSRLSPFFDSGLRAAVCARRESAPEKPRGIPAPLPARCCPPGKAGKANALFLERAEK